MEWSSRERGGPAVTRFLSHARLRWIGRWVAILVEFTFVQGVAQLIGMLAGIAVVRLLSPNQYALYTIANAMMSALFLFSESGIASAITGIGGRVWQDPVRLGRAIFTALNTANRLRNAACVPVLAVLIWLLHRNGAGLVDIATLAPLILIGGSLSLQTQVLLAAPRLVAAVRLQQHAALAAPALRLLATVVLGIVGLMAGSAMFAIVLGNLTQFLIVQRWARRRMRLDAPVDAGVRSELKAVVTRQLPNVFYYVFQSQLSIWLLSVFGSVVAVADVGAVTRISALFSVLLATAQGVIIPRFARCQDPHRLPILYRRILLGFAVLSAVPVLIAWSFPQALLWILGAQYAHLPKEMLLAVIEASTASLGFLVWGLNANRGWFMPAWITIPVGFAAQLASVLAIGASTVGQVLLVAICNDVVGVSLWVVAAAVFMRRYRRGEATTTAHATARDGRETGRSEG